MTSPGQAQRFAQAPADLRDAEKNRAVVVHLRPHQETGWASYFVAGDLSRFFVMAGHSRSKNGHRFRSPMSPAIHVLFSDSAERRGSARDKARGHDGSRES